MQVCTAEKCLYTCAFVALCQGQSYGISTGTHQEMSSQRKGGEYIQLNCVIRKNESMTFAGKGVELHITVLSKISQTMINIARSLSNMDSQRVCVCVCETLRAKRGKEKIFEYTWHESRKGGYFWWGRRPVREGKGDAGRQCERKVKHNDVSKLKCTTKTNTFMLTLKLRKINK